MFGWHNLHWESMFPLKFSLTSWWVRVEKEKIEEKKKKSCKSVKANKESHHVMASRRNHHQRSFTVAVRWHFVILNEPQNVIDSRQTIENWMEANFKRPPSKGMSKANQQKPNKLWGMRRAVKIPSVKKNIDVEWIWFRDMLSAQNQIINASGEMEPGRRVEVKAVKITLNKFACWFSACALNFHTFIEFPWRYPCRVRDRIVMSVAMIRDERWKETREQWEERNHEFLVQGALTLNLSQAWRDFLLNGKQRIKKMIQ